jgi:intein-encoded DNA endonuclease-like protein
MPNKIEYTELQKQEIIKDYKNGLSCQQIGKKYNHSPTPIHKILKDHNIEIRDSRWAGIKYKTDNHLFDNIDCEWKAYFLGLMYADGCMDKNFEKVIITLAEKDRDILDKLNNLIFDGKRKLYYRPKMKMENGSKYTRQGRYTLVLSNQSITKQLFKKGLKPQKSLNLDFPPEKVVPDNLFHHFIRGYFDGDGCLYTCHRPYQTKRGIKKYHHFSWEIVSSHIFCEKMRLFLEKKLNITLNMLKKEKISSLKSTKIKNVSKILNYIYKDATIFLNRKYEKYKFFLDIYPEF